MKKYLVWLWQNTRGIRLNMLVRIVAGIGRVAFGLLMVWLCKRFIDVTIQTGTRDDILYMIMALVVVISGGIICRQIDYYLCVKANAFQSTSIRLRIFSHLFRRQMFDQKEMHSGDVTSRLEKDIDVVSNAITTLAPDTIVTLVQLIGAFLFMNMMDARLAWALLLLTPLFFVVGKLFARKLRKMTLDIRRQESIIQMLVQETMEHNAVLRSLESDDWVTGRLDDMQQIYGHYPYNSGFTTVSSQQYFTIQQDQTTDDGYLNSDLMTADNAPATRTKNSDGTWTVNKTSNLIFKHQMVKFVITVDTDESHDANTNTDGSGLTIKSRKSFAFVHPDILTIWHTLKTAHSRGFEHMFFLDVGLPFQKNAFRDFILAFGGKQTSGYRWFHCSIGWINRLLSWFYRD